MRRRKLERAEEKLCQKKIEEHKAVLKGLDYDIGTAQRDLDIGLEIKFERAKAQVSQNLRSAEETKKMLEAELEQFREWIVNGVPPKPEAKVMGEE